MTTELEKKILILEDRLFGKANRDSDYPKMVDSMNSINALLNSSIKGKPNLEAVFKRILELDQYLEFDHVDQQVLSTEVKINLILSVKDVLLEQAEALENIESMCDVLGSEHIKVVPGLQSDLYQLSKIHMEQQDQADKSCSETQDLLNQYNSIIGKLSLQFCKWNETISLIIQNKDNQFNGSDLPEEDTQDIDFSSFQIKETDLPVKIDNIIDKSDVEIKERNIPENSNELIEKIDVRLPEENKEDNKDLSN